MANLAMFTIAATVGAGTLVAEPAAAAAAATTILNNGIDEIAIFAGHSNANENNTITITPRTPQGGAQSRLP
jgi:hypothetical protein